MKIAVSSLSESTNSPVDFRFGRAPYFIIFEIEGNEIRSHKAIKNPGVTAMSGAGVIAAQTLVKEGVEAVITGNIGPNSFALLKSQGVKIFSGIGGINVEEAVKKYLRGELKESKFPTKGFGRFFGGPGGGRGFGRGF